MHVCMHARMTGRMRISFSQSSSRTCSTDDETSSSSSSSISRDRSSSITVVVGVRHNFFDGRWSSTGSRAVAPFWCCGCSTSRGRFGVACAEDVTRVEGAAIKEWGFKASRLEGVRVRAGDVVVFTSSAPRTRRLLGDASISFCMCVGVCVCMCASKL